jgi:hypothetical protein
MSEVYICAVATWRKVQPGQFNYEPGMYEKRIEFEYSNKPFAIPDLMRHINAGRTFVVQQQRKNESLDETKKRIVDNMKDAELADVVDGNLVRA